MGLKDDLLLQKLKIGKNRYEQASRENGTKGTINEIRTSYIINQIHEYIKAELIAQEIDALKIFPPLGQTSPEIKLTGFLKRKKQDITVMPSVPHPEEITEGPLLGEIDKIGKEVTNKSLSINVRSQWSSLAKNLDTLYERTFAESLNLHMRNPELVMGELYLVPLIAYDPDARGIEEIRFRERLPANKYISAFHAINNRGVSGHGHEHKYERVCLLIVDFRPEQPRIITNATEIQEVETLTATNASYLNGLTVENFVSDILQIYKDRHGSLNPLRSSRL